MAASGRAEGSLGSAAPAAAAPDIRALFDTHFASVWRLLRRLGVARSAIDDAAQEVFWIAARRLADIERGRERAFLYGVAVRIASHEHRRQRAMPEHVDLEELSALHDAEPSPEQRFEQQQARALLDVVLDGMPLDLRTVFVLAELEELEVREIAALEGIPLGTASSRLRRAREEFSAVAKRVRARLQKSGGGR